jgi:hypothetical protein
MNKYNEYLLYYVTNLLYNSNRNEIIKKLDAAIAIAIAAHWIVFLALVIASSSFAKSTCANP